MSLTGRYSRQTILPEIGDAGQEKLAKASVLCVGAGGLGSPALLYLAAAGVGRIGIVDFDRVDESNLQRQVLFSTDQVGTPKTGAARERLLALNPFIAIDIYEGFLDEEKAEYLFPSFDIIIDGTDNFSTKFLINDAAVKFGKPLVYGAIQGFDGQASVFNYLGGACYRCLYPGPPKERIANCAEAGVIGAVAGLVGVTQALQAIGIICGEESFDVLAGRLWIVDTKTMQTRILSIPRNPQCPCCSLAPENIVLQAPEAASCAPAAPKGRVQEMDIKGARSCEGHVFIDVREEPEWAAGTIDNALLWPLSRMMSGSLPELSRDAPIILYCQKGFRSLQAAEILISRGYTRLYNLSGGYDAWRF